MWINFTIVHNPIAEIRKLRPDRLNNLLKVSDIVSSWDVKTGNLILESVALLSLKMEPASGISCGKANRAKNQ